MAASPAPAPAPAPSSPPGAATTLRRRVLLLGKGSSSAPSSHHQHNHHNHHHHHQSRMNTNNNNNNSTASIHLRTTSKNSHIIQRRTKSQHQQQQQQQQQQQEQRHRHHPSEHQADTNMRMLACEMARQMYMQDFAGGNDGNDGNNDDDDDDDETMTLLLKQKNSSSKSKSRSSSQRILEETRKLPKFHPEEVTKGALLGSGGFGDVYEIQKFDILLASSTGTSSTTSTSTCTSTSSTARSAGALAGRQFIAKHCCYQYSDNENPHHHHQLQHHQQHDHHHKDENHHPHHHHHHREARYVIKMLKPDILFSSNHHHHHHHDDEQDYDDNEEDEDPQQEDEESSTRTSSTSSSTTTTTAAAAAGNIMNDLCQAVADLNVETRILSSIDHPNIIKLRAIGKGPRFHPGYFIVLDRLYDTLETRIQKWRRQQQQQQQQQRGGPGGGRGQMMMKTTTTKHNNKNHDHHHPHHHLSCWKGLLLKGKMILRDHHDVDDSSCSIITHHPSKQELCCWQERLRVGYDLSSALAYLHDHRIIHRDLKPQNIGFDIRDDIKLFDFGLAKELPPRMHLLLAEDDDSSEEERYCMSLCGSYPYMPPEVALEEPYNQTCDVYSFAIVLWEMLALKPAYESYYTTASRKHNKNKNNNSDHQDDYLMRNVFVPPYERPLIKETWPTPLQALLHSSWHPTPSCRPSMQHVEECLLAEWCNAAQQ